MRSDDLEAKVAWLNDRTGRPFEAVRDYGRQHLGWDTTTPTLGSQAVKVQPEPVDWLAELTKQVRLSNLIQWAAITNNTKGHAAAITEGLDL